MENILYAKILKTKGLKGELKLNVLSKNFDLLEKGLVLIREDKSEIIIKSFYTTNKGAFVLFEGIESISQAEELIGESLYINKSSLPKLKDGEYYMDDLIDCFVYSEKGVNLGVITSINNYGSADIISVSLNGKTTDIPFIQGLIISFDKKENIITMSDEILEEVLIDEN